MTQTNKDWLTQLALSLAMFPPTLELAQRVSQREHNLSTYRGWKLTYDTRHSIFRAERFGVGMCNNTKESLQRMIDERLRCNVSGL